MTLTYFKIKVLYSYYIAIDIQLRLVIFLPSQPYYLEVITCLNFFAIKK